MLLFTVKTTGKDDNPCYQVQILHNDCPVDDAPLFSRWPWITEEFAKYCKAKGNQKGMRCKPHKFGSDITIYFHNITFWDIKYMAENFCHSRNEPLGMIQL